MAALHSSAQGQRFLEGEDGKKIRKVRNKNRISFTEVIGVNDFSINSSDFFRFYMQALLPEIVHPFRGQVQFFKKIDHTYIREAEYVIKAKQARQAAEEAKALKKSANEEKECREKDIEKNENNGKGKGIDKENDKDINKDVGRKRGRKPKGNVEIRENLENAQKKKGRPRKNNKENIPRIDTENDKEIKIVGKKRRRKPKENVENKENFENNKENGQKKNGRKRRSNQENIPAVLEKRSKQHFR